MHFKKLLKIFEKKKTEAERRASPEQRTRREEARKTQRLILNIAAYDGTERGQKPIE